MSKPLTPEKWQQIQEVFLQAVELSPNDRERMLNKFDSETLRRTVADLIEADEQERGFLETSPIKFIESTNGESEMPERIGRYRIVREIGRGGMGAVYLAARETDFGKQVAVKVIKRGMDTDEILRRFRHERQILAALEHPNIARLLDGGTTDQGAPFLVMEYVEDTDLIEYCRANKLALGERLRLFRKICSAVAYAHQNLIVHRDLKPSNIIVSNDGEPKLLDFGISKLLSTEGAANDTGTATALGMMTPAYASPEQFRGEPVTTATDVYSLGVILFELLTGKLPYDVKNRRFDEAARIVNETEPKLPSAVISNYGLRLTDSKKTNRQASATKDQAQDQTNPKSIVQNPKSLRGDLDNIVLKALRKDAARRYSSVEQFAEDVRRHQTGLPVLAHADTFSYRAQKFVQRNRVPVVFSALLILALVGGIAATTWALIRAESQRVLAEKRFNEVRQIANNVIFKYYDAIANVEGATKAREMIVTDASAYLDRLSQDSISDDSLKLELAQAYMRIGIVQGGANLANVGNTNGAVVNYEKAIPMLEELNRKKPNDQPIVLQLVEAHKLLGVIQIRTDMETAREHFQRAVELAENLVNSQPAADSQRAKTLLANALITSARGLPRSTEPGGGVEAINKAVPILDSLLIANPNDEAILSQMWLAQNQLGVQYGTIADGIDRQVDSAKSFEITKKAADHFHNAGEVAKTLMIIQPNSAVYRRDFSRSKANESTALSQIGQVAEALVIQRELLEKAERAAAADAANVDAQIHVYNIQSQMGETYSVGKQLPAARETLDQAMILLDKLIGKDGTNAELQRKKFELYNNLAAASEDQPAAAIREIRAAYSYAQTASTLKNTNFVGFAEGKLHELTGDVYVSEAKAQPKTANTKLQAAITEYETALAKWQNADFAPKKFGYSAETTKTVEQKMQNCAKQIQAN